MVTRSTKFKKIKLGTEKRSTQAADEGIEISMSVNGKRLFSNAFQ